MLKSFFITNCGTVHQILHVFFYLHLHLNRSLYIWIYISLIKIIGLSTMIDGLLPHLVLNLIYIRDIEFHSVFCSTVQLYRKILNFRKIPTDNLSDNSFKLTKCIKSTLNDAQTLEDTRV